jgi:hypothetical protein
VLVERVVVEVVEELDTRNRRPFLKKKILRINISPALFRLCYAAIIY